MAIYRIRYVAILFLYFPLLFSFVMLMLYFYAYGEQRGMDNFLSVKEAVLKYIDGCHAKSTSSFMKILGKAMFAGMMIGMGAAGSNVAAHAVTNVGLSRVIAGTIFPVGLMMVILLGAELFTGDCLFAMAVSAKKETMMKFVQLLVTVFLGNMIGAVIFTSFIYMSGQLDYSGGLLGAYTIKVALGKCNLSFSKALVSGILCNILVSAAVLMATCAKDVTGKLMASFFVILLFVTSGFEHCVANMYYIPAGLMAKMNPQYVQVAIDSYGFSEAQLESLDLFHFLITNLIPVTIGNILGGAVFLGVPLYYLNCKTKEGTAK